MRMKLSLALMALMLTLSATGYAAPVKHKKYSAEHKAAVKKCNEDYASARKDAKTKKGKERKDAEAAARQARKQCLASAPM